MDPCMRRYCTPLLPRAWRSDAGRSKPSTCQFLVHNNSPAMTGVRRQDALPNQIHPEKQITPSSQSHNAPPHIASCRCTRSGRMRQQPRSACPSDGHCSIVLGPGGSVNRRRNDKRRGDGCGSTRNGADSCNAGLLQSIGTDTSKTQLRDALADKLER